MKAGASMAMSLLFILGTTLPPVSKVHAVEATILRVRFTRTPQSFLNASEDQKETYAQGLVDGFLSARLFFGDASKLSALQECLSAMSLAQVAAVLDRYIMAHQDRWGWAIQILAYDAFAGACPKFNKD